MPVSSAGRKPSAVTDASPRVIAVLVAAGMVVIGVLVFVATALLTQGDLDTARPSDQYCVWLDPIDAAVSAVRAGVAGAPPSTAPPGSTAKPTDVPARRAWSYRASLADEGPAGHDADSRTVVDAIRQAVADGSPAPLDRPAVRAAVRRLRDPVHRACRVPLVNT
ncbi:MAG: hypothetical protein JWM05_2394 [Acidimicrobiales bacterium]|nr:hypothetical protein [Acidimicrobiales bacterium]